VSDLRVALTFDAEHPSRPHCPPDATERLLRALAGDGVRATFFLQGRWASAYPDLGRRIAGDGHLVGNHSHYHARFSALSSDGMAEDLRRAHDAIAESTGVDPRPWFRFPFGDGEGDPAVARAPGASGYRHVGWDVDPCDWDPSGSIAAVERAVVDGVLSRGDGAVVLLHGWPDWTPEATPRIVARLKAEGARFVSVDDLAVTGRLGTS
jgi:peptidoglycan/xylan/chitin deacetylase (PgdA/CDA1 family)